MPQYRIVTNEDGSVTLVPYETEGGGGGSSTPTAVELTTVQTAANQAAQLALTTQEGDVVVRTDLNKTYMRNAGTSGTMSDFTELKTPTDSVTSVNSRTGAVTGLAEAVDLAAVALSGSYEDLLDAPAGAQVVVQAEPPVDTSVLWVDSDDIAGAAGGLESVVAGDNVAVDDTDPLNPVVSASGVLESIVAGDNVTVDDTDPANPIVSAAGGGGGGAAIPQMHWFNTIFPGNTNGGNTPGSEIFANGAGGYVKVQTTNAVTYITNPQSGSYDNSLNKVGGWGVGQTAYWYWNPFLADFTNAGSIKLFVGDGQTQTGSTHNSGGSYGFYTDQDNSILYAFTYDGTTETRVDVTSSMSSGPSDIALYAAVFTPGVDVKFYNNGVLLATITTHIPSTATTFNGYMGGNVKTETNTQINLTLGYMGIDINLY